MLTGLFLLAALFAILLYALTPETPAARGPILLASFIAILIGSLLCDSVRLCAGCCVRITSLSAKRNARPRRARF